MLTGSMGLALHGVPVKPNDIDLQTNEQGSYEIEKLFYKYSKIRVAYSCTDRIRSHFGSLDVNGMKVEIMEI